MAHGLQMQQDDTKDGKTVFTPEEHENLRDAAVNGKMTDAQFEDWNRAEAEGRVRDPDAEEGGTWTREEWEQAADRTDEMSEEEFEDWDNAPKEGRVE